MSDLPPQTICFAALHPPLEATDPHRYLQWAPILSEIPSRIAEKGYEVHVVQHFPQAHSFSSSGVKYHFEGGPAALTLGAARMLGRLTSASPAALLPARGAIRKLRSLRPDLIHLHGSSLHLNHFLMVRLLRRQHPRVVVQYHGGYPSPNRVARRIQQFNFGRTHRFLFTTRSHAEPFVEAGLIDTPERIIEFMQTSSTFAPLPRRRARALTGMYGDPVFLSAARLEPVKDPLTALRGFESILSHRPDANLYMCYLTDDMLPELKAFVDARPAVRRSVHFMGRVPYDQMESVYNSADFLLQASRREIMGRSVLEAMSCGVIPAVTSIPSFRAITDDGRCGVLFSTGNAEMLARGVLAIPAAEISALADRVRRRFESALSFSALANQLDKIYADVLGDHGFSRE